MLLYGPSASDNAESFKLSEMRLSTLMCFVKSSLISKPNSFEADLDAESSQADHDLMRLVQRDSALRYSIIGNWITYVVGKHFDDDQIELVEQLSKFASYIDVISLSIFLDFSLIKKILIKI